MASPGFTARKLHRVGAVLVAIPFGLVLGTGLLLQVKKQIAWVQPPEQRAAGDLPEVSWDAILTAARAVPEARIASWRDVDRVDVRPGKGMAKVLSTSRWELQIDLRDGRLLQSAYRRTDLIEDLHTGAWFADFAKLWVFLPVALVVVVLWATGVLMAWRYYRARWRARRA